MRHAFLFGSSIALLSGAILFGAVAPVQKRVAPESPSWPMFGGTPARNMVNLREHGLPTDWSVEQGKVKNIKWAADLGRKTFSTPVVAEGMVLIGTNKPLKKGDDNRAALLAFRESDGKLLWENGHDAWYKPHQESGGFGVFGLVSTPTVHDRFVYYVTPSCEVVCADNADGKVAWKYDMAAELKVVPFTSLAPYCVALSNASSPLVVGDHVFVSTGHGLDPDWKLTRPAAPSFIALHRKSGKLAWQSNLPGKNIIEGQYSSPAFAEVDGVPQVIFAGGDGVIYSFGPATGELLWKCDCLPFRKKATGEGQGPRASDNYFVSAPVIVKDRLYVGMGTHREVLGSRGSYFLCLDITKKGDVSLKSHDAKADANKSSALVWAFGGPVVPETKKGRRTLFGKTASTAAVHDGLVYITEEDGYLHCLDAASGERYWQHDFRANVCGSPYLVDGRVFVCTEDGEVIIYATGRTAKVLATIDMDDVIYSSPVAANGTLYIATSKKLYAISSR